jgi:hypothetical protein
MKTRIESNEPVFIADLKLTVAPGTPTWVDMDVAKGSMCLAQLVRLGKLKVSTGKRCAMSKDPPRVPYRAGRMSRPNKGGMQKPFGSTAVPPSPPPTAAGMSQKDAEDLATKAATQAAALVAEQVVQQVIQQVTLAAPTTSSDDLEERIARAVASALAAHGGAVSGKQTSRGPEEPLFIPTGIVQDDASELKVSSATASSGGLDEAAKALKALRKSSKSKT